MIIEKLFEHWFVAPLRWLQEIPNNDGSFIALATVLFLYERYVIAYLKSKGVKAMKKGIIQQVADDFEVDNKIATDFWDVMRNGILHQGMPKQMEQGEKKFPDWIFHHTKDTHPIEIRDIDNSPVLFVQPWMVLNKVIALWQENMELIDKNVSFPWAEVFSLDNNVFEDTDGEIFLVTGSSSGLGFLNKYT